jgi:hypothetical protein
MITDLQRIIIGYNLEKPMHYPLFLCVQIFYIIQYN